MTSGEFLDTCILHQPMELQVSKVAFSVHLAARCVPLESYWHSHSSSHATRRPREVHARATAHCPPRAESSMCSWGDRTVLCRQLVSVTIHPLYRRTVYSMSADRTT